MFAEVVAQTWQQKPFLMELPLVHEGHFVTLNQSKNIIYVLFYNLMYVSASTGSSFGRTSRRRQLVVISWGECAVRSLRLTDRAVNQFPRPPQQQINHDILQRSRTSLHHFFFSPTRNWKYLCGGEIVPICGGSTNVLTNYSCQHIVAAPWHFGS